MDGSVELELELAKREGEQVDLPRVNSIQIGDVQIALRLVSRHPSQDGPRLGGFTSSVSMIAGGVDHGWLRYRGAGLCGGVKLFWKLALKWIPGEDGFVIHIPLSEVTRPAGTSRSAKGDLQINGHWLPVFQI